MDPEAPGRDGRSPSLTEEGPADSLSALFGDLARGNTAALEGIYDAMAKELYGLALWRTGAPSDAEDVVQSVFVRLAVQTAERLTAVREPRPYLLAMVHRACVDLHRGRAARAAGPVEEATFLHAPPDDPGRGMDACRISAKLIELPTAQREAIFLHHFCDLTFADVGRVTGVPTFTAASRFRNGIRALRRLMGLSR